MSESTQPSVGRHDFVGGVLFAVLAVVALGVSIYHPGNAGFFGPIAWVRVFCILVGLSIPRMHSFKHQFYITTMISDLRNLAATEEGYWSSVDSYSSDFNALRFNVTPGVWVTFVQADSMGWSASATHDSDTSHCAIYYGNAPALPPATVKNFVGCSK